MPAPRVGIGVGIGVFVLSPTTGKFLMGIRKGSLGSGTLALPGGHLDFGESFEECAMREVKEETDVDLDAGQVRFLTAVSTVLEDGKKHYVTVFMVAPMREEKEGQVKLMEPEKCEGWDWVEWEEMKAWALHELERTTVEDDGRDGMANMTKLFLPLLTLIRERPNAIPALVPPQLEKK